MFNERLETFRSFVSESGLGVGQLKQYEMTYATESGTQFVAASVASWRDRERPSVGCS